LVPGKIEIEVNGTPTTCTSESGTITITITGGTPGYIFTWIGPDGFTSAIQNLTELAQGIYTVVVTDANGCEATETFSISLNNNGSLTEVNETACIEFTWTDGDSNSYSESGIYDYIVVNAQGCNDTLRLNLTINNGSLTEVNETACIEFTWTDGDSNTYSESGIYDYIVVNAQGCNDTLRLNLTINIGSLTEVNETACIEFTWTDGDSNTYSESGIYDYIVVNAQGCNDTLRLNLTINNGSLTEVNETACIEFTWTDGDSNSYSESGIYDYIVVNAQGCNDTLRLNLTINNGSLTEVNETACIEFTWTAMETVLLLRIGYLRLHCCQCPRLQRYSAPQPDHKQRLAYRSDRNRLRRVYLD
jgi:trimeric autotransporter adhesin